MDSAVKYLVAGSVFSVVTSVLWCLWARFERSLQSFIFQCVATRFNLSYHNLQGVSNIVTITRILDQLQLKTHTYLWQHEVNVDSDDSIMTGYVRLPAQTWFLWGLSLLGISHYVWVKHDAREIVAVGPTDFIHALFRVSTDCANCEVPGKEMESLGSLLRARTPRTVAEGRCVWCERWIIISLQSVLLVLNAVKFHRWFLVTVLAVSILCFVYCWCQAAFRRCGAELTSALAMFWRKRSGFWRLRRSDANDTFAEGAEALLSIGQPSLELTETAELESGAATPTEEPPASGELDMDVPHYSVVIARGNWYEVSFRRRLPTSIGQSAVERQDMQGCCVYAMPLRVEMPDYLAARVQTDCVLYVCIHNPMTETPIIEMLELMKKATRTVALIVILPPIETLDNALSSASSLRLHGNKETKFVATYCDWASWLTLLTSGVFAQMWLVMPYCSSTCLAESQAWYYAQRIARSETLDEDSS